MVNGDYWIYSDGNAKTILARGEGTPIWLLDNVHLDPRRSIFVKTN